MGRILCRNECGALRSNTACTSDGDLIPECHNCGDAGYTETYEIEYNQRWDDVFGYVKIEYDIDANLHHVVFHLEHGGYFTGYYMGLDILKPEEQASYSFIMDQMVRDLENVD